VRRLATARKELDRLSEYDYIVINENNKSKEAAEKIAKIIECEKLKVSRNSDFESKFYKDK